MKFGSISFYKRMLSIALPVMAQLFIQNLVSLIDNFMVAGLGDIKMSGVNIAGQINFIFLVLVNAVFCAGAGIFMSQYKGAQDRKGMQFVFNYKLLICLFAAICYTLFCLINPSPVLSLMVKGNTSAKDIVAQAVSYEKIIAWTWIPMAMSSVFSSSLREIGNVKAPLVISVCATIVNTIGNYILIYGNFGAPRLEVAGAAIATIIARATEMITFIIYIKKTKPSFIKETNSIFEQIKSLFSINFTLVGRIASKSSLIIVSEMCWVFSETIATALYNSRGGAEIVSGMSAGFTIANLFFAGLSGLYTATGVVMGTTLGSGELEKAREQKSWIVNGGLVFGFFVMILGFSSTLLIPTVFANLSEIARQVASGLVISMALYMPMWCLLNAQFSISRTGGDTMMGAIVDITVNILLFVPGMFLLTYFTKLGPVIMYSIVKLSDIAKVIVATLWLKKERWLKNLAEKL